MIVKLTRPIGEDQADEKVTLKEGTGSVSAEFPLDEHFRKLFGPRYTVYMEAELSNEGLKLLHEVPLEKW